jgi:transposase
LSLRTQHLSDVMQPAESHTFTVARVARPPLETGSLASRRYIARISSRCCCKRLLAAQPDFASERSGLERVVALGGHLCLFLPKFHCELNMIERYWGAGKKYARRHCSYSLVGLREVVPIALSQTREELPEELRSRDDLPVSPIFKQRRWWRISWQFAAEYRKGARAAEAVRAVAEQRTKRHRDTNDGRSRQAEAAMEALAFAGACPPVVL